MGGEPLLIVGLGNPGEGYRNTRHNVGFLLVDLLADSLGLELKKPLFKNYLKGKASQAGGEFHLVKPLCYMNHSGEILPGLLRASKLPLSRLIVVVDNMDLPVGRVRMKLKGSSAGHNGLKSLIAHLGTPDFQRLYVGIGRPKGGITVVDHVLGEFNSDEWTRLEGTLGDCVEILLESPPLKDLLEKINGIDQRDL